MDKLHVIIIIMLIYIILNLNPCKCNGNGTVTEGFHGRRDYYGRHENVLYRDS